MSQIKLWSISSKYFTLLIIGSYFPPFFHNIVRALFLHIWLKICMYFSYHKMVFEILKGKRDIAEFFQDTTVFLMRKTRAKR